MARLVAKRVQPEAGRKPVVFFNASTRLNALSYNAAYQQLAAWALRLQGVAVIHFVCDRGMSRCVQGTDRDNPDRLPPCGSCLAQSRAIYQDSTTARFDYLVDRELAARLDGLSLIELLAFRYREMPLGTLVGPSLRWVLRRYHLTDDAPTRFLCANYILSAWNVASRFRDLISESKPQAVVVFNGTFYPEAAACWVAHQEGLRVVTHETGFLPFTGFFTSGIATAYPLDPETDFQLSVEQEARLDTYLAQRFKGNFSMAGIRFWPEIKGLEGALLEKIDRFSQMVPIFTNVIFDTSQEHANVIFPDMFAWLDQLMVTIRMYPDTLFVLRAHPDEGRKGKASRETVAGWAASAGLTAEPNVVFIKPDEYVSSYELVERAKFVLVYNSSIGLESSILGKAVLSAGKVRYHTPGCQTVSLPGTNEDYFEQLNEWITDGKLQAPAEWRTNARRFLYHQVFQASLPFDRFLKAEGEPGFVGLADFAVEDLTPERSETVRVLVEGILEGKPFLLEE